MVLKRSCIVLTLLNQISPNKSFFYTGFGLVCTLTACGATFCYLLARLAGQDVAVKYFPSKIETFKKKLEDNYERLPWFLLFLRLFPASPNWAINMCCGVLNVPIHIFFATALVTFDDTSII